MRRVIKFALLALLFVAAAGVSAFWVMTLMVKGEETVVVPQLEGRDVVYALEMLTTLGLNTKVRGAEYSDQVPANHVVWQQPEAGSEIKKDRDVRIVLSKGAATVVMPNLVGLPLRQASGTVEENGLCVGVRSTCPSRQLEKEAVLAQFPPAGERVPRGRCIDLLVSTGPPPRARAMPDLSGFRLEEALLRMEANGLVPGQVRTDFRPGSADNTVLSQAPAAGHRVIAGQSVGLVIHRRGVEPGAPVAAGHTGIGYFTHRVENGFLKRRVRIRLNAFGTAIDLQDSYLAPGTTVEALVPRHIGATVLLYVDDELVRTEFYE